MISENKSCNPSLAMTSFASTAGLHPLVIQWGRSCRETTARKPGGFFVAAILERPMRKQSSLVDSQALPFNTLSATRSQELSPGKDDFRGCQLWPGFSHRSKRHLASRDDFTDGALLRQRLDQIASFICRFTASEESVLGILRQSF